MVGIVGALELVGIIATQHVWVVGVEHGAAGQGADEDKAEDGGTSGHDEAPLHVPTETGKDRDPAIVQRRRTAGQNIMETGAVLTRPPVGGQARTPMSELTPTVDLNQASEFAGVAERLAAVDARIAAAARGAGRAPGDVALVAVAKTQPQAAVAAALAAGQRRFGENRVQEALAKYPALKERAPDLRLHLIGPLQTNKAKEAVALFDVIESLDRPHLAEALARAMARQNRRPACLIEVNTGAEAQKSGVAPGAADGFIALCRDTLALPVVGLMGIPPEGEEPAPHFALLREIARRNGLAALSMGMSADFEIAIRFGATSVRVGTAIFGARRPAPV